uniref:Uncharacterized protein n=1 Tax=Escherichia coli TaxID=562 RepID=A0A9P1NSG5_ECOLX|nr:hypothetical protein HUS41_pII0093 [Escherichia coli]
MQHQHGGEPPGVVFVLCFMIVFCIRHRSVLGIGAMIGIAQSAW